ncbi:MAG: hypothetical protein ABFD25_06260 [Clostridiaceae bacterium]
MIIKSPKPTGDLFVDECYQFEFEEYSDPRRWFSLPIVKDIPDLASTDKRKALAIAESLMQDYSDYSFLFYWIGKLKGELGFAGEPSFTLLDGLKKGRNKPVLCGGLAINAFEKSNLSEAVKWWIKSCAIQLSCHLSTDSFSLLNLAYIAEGLHLPVCQKFLYQKAQALQSVKFDSIGASQRYTLAKNQGSRSIKAAIKLLCSFYVE